MVKICKRCGIEKQVSDFYFDAHNKNYKTSCKECCRAVERSRTLIYQDKMRDSRKKYYQSNRQKRLDYEKMRASRDWDKINARHIGYCRIKETQPCEVCGQLETERHHEDYSKPLEIKWLCSRHHKQVHFGLVK